MKQVIGLILLASIVMAVPASGPFMPPAPPRWPFLPIQQWMWATPGMRLAMVLKPLLPMERPSVPRSRVPVSGLDRPMPLAVDLGPVTGIAW